jgi:mannitol operon transcriptional antiterminator
MMVNRSEKNITITLNERESKKTASSLLKELSAIKEYAHTIGTILEGFELEELHGLQTTQGILDYAVKELFERNKIQNIDAVVYAISEREKLGGLGIPETTMALFHTRSPAVLEPCFTIYTVAKPIEVVGMDGKIMGMKSLILMLSPEVVSERVLEVLSCLSSLLIESEESISVFQSNDQGRIETFLTARFDQFFDEKLKGIRSV